MSKKKSKGEDEAGQALAEESQVRPDEVADVKPKKKGKSDEGAASVDRAKDAAPHPEEVTKPKPKMELKDYERELARLEIELVKLQEWIKIKGLKVVVIFEGRDAAGKGGTIKTITECLNPRICRVVALGVPTEREKSQWYFQRYVAHLPAAGEMVLFDRSWYNRAGVEHVMGFCTEDEYREYLRSCPEFERMLVRAGIILIKYWFSVSDEEQERRFRAGWKNPPSVGRSARWTWNRASVGWSIPRPRTPCLPPRISNRRPGLWSIPMTRSVRGSM